MTYSQPELKEPLSPSEAKHLIGQILETGILEWWDHALKQLADRKLSTVDCENVLKGGWVEKVEPVVHGPYYGAWRYTFTTRAIGVVIQFVSSTHAMVITAWRI